MRRGLSHILAPSLFHSRNPSTASLTYVLFGFAHLLPMTRNAFLQRQPVTLRDMLTIKSNIRMLSPPPFTQEAPRQYKLSVKKRAVPSLSREPIPDHPSRLSCLLRCVSPPFTTFLLIIRPLIIWVLSP